MMMRTSFPRATVAAAALSLVPLLPVPSLAGYSEGMDCLKKKDWGCVVEQFQMEVEAHPDYAFGWAMIGIAHLQRNEYGPAIESLNKAIEIDGGKLSYYVNKAKAYIDQKQYDKVISILEGKQSLDGTQLEVYSMNYQLGTAYHQLSRHQKAIPYLEKSAAVKPEFTTLYMLGVSYDAVGNVDKSLGTLKEALKQKPGDAEVQGILAATYLNLAGNEKNKSRKAQFYTEAVRYAEGAVKASPRDHLKQNLLARAYLGANQYDRAEAVFKKVLEIEPSYCFAKINLGKVYIAKKSWKSAVGILEQATRCMPDSDVAWESLGFAQEKIYKSLDTDGEKIAQLNKALASFREAARRSSRSSIQASIDRVQQNIHIAQQNQAIARKNIQTMEVNLKNLQRGKEEALAALQKLEDTRQFFLDKGNWPDEKEQEYRQEKAEIEKAIADLDRRITRQRDELRQAREALQPA